MTPLELALDAELLAGLVLATARVAGFVVASPLLPRSIPLMGRVGLVIALSLFLADPVSAPLSVAGLVGAGVTNAGIGIVLGYLTGALFHLFAVAGGLVDLTSGLSYAALVDPTQGQQAAVFSRLFNLAALALFFALGGLGIIVQGLALSVEAIPLDAGIRPQSGLLDLAIQLLGRLMVAGIEIAMPVMAVLFLVEVVLGLASRFAPQANILVLGLSAKLAVTMTIVSLCVLLFPEALGGLQQSIGDTFRDTLLGLRLT